MADPFAQVLPQVFHFSHLQGTQFVLLLGIIMFFGALGGRIFQKLKIQQTLASNCAFPKTFLQSFLET